jgi:CBS domain-containing protein
VRLLLQNQIGGAPVINAEGKCVGVLSAFDVLRLAERRADVTKPTAPSLPITCSYQKKQRGPDGTERVLCTLPPGVCPIQVQQVGPDRKQIVVCGQPHCVLMDWQMVDMEKLPTDEVARFMTPQPVTAAPSVSIRDLARMLVDAHVHRIIVVNDKQEPIGIVSSTDLLAALMNAKENN